MHHQRPSHARSRDSQGSGLKLKRIHFTPLLHWNRRNLSRSGCPKNGVPCSICGRAHSCIPLFQHNPCFWNNGRIVSHGYKLSCCEKNFLISKHFYPLCQRRTYQKKTKTRQRRTRIDQSLKRKRGKSKKLINKRLVKLELIFAWAFNSNTMLLLTEEWEETGDVEGKRYVITLWLC